MHLSYHLRNHTLRENYHGVCQAKRVEKRFKEHAAGKTKAIDHWLPTDDVELVAVKRHRTQGAASRASHAAERKGTCCVGKRLKKHWCNHCTAGI